jgi:hypothetical protein
MASSKPLGSVTNLVEGLLDKDYIYKDKVFQPFRSSNYRGISVVCHHAIAITSSVKRQRYG